MGANKNLTDQAYNAPNWNGPLNANFDNIDSAFGGVQSFNLASASGTVSVSGGSYAGPYPANTASYVPLTWLLTGTMTANVNLQLPASVGGQWAVYNSTSGAYTVTVSSATGGGTTVTIPQGGVQQIYCDQTNVNYSSLPYGSNLTIPGTLSMSSSFLRNKFINGDLSIDQYNSGNSATITTGGGNQYIVSRWYATASGASVACQRISSGSSPNIFLEQITGAGGNTNVTFNQRIIQTNSYDLANGNVTLSLYTAMTLGLTITWTVSYVSGGGANNFGALTTAATGTWTSTASLTRYSATFAMPSAATNGIQVTFSVNNLTSGTWNIGLLQIEPGSLVTPFERRPFEQTAAACDKYYYVIADNGSAATWYGTGIITAATNGVITFPLPDMIQIPAFFGWYVVGDYEISTASGTKAVSSISPSFTSCSPQLMVVNFICSGASFTEGQACFLRATASGAGAQLQISSEF